VKFTFIVLSYNQQEFIVDNLNSIAVQVTNNFKDYKCSLIVADDSSSDLTLERIYEWVEKYRHLFYEVRVLDSELNLGTCKNYTRAIRYVSEGEFKVLAADDIYTENDFTDIVNKLKFYDSILTPVIPFTCLKTIGIDKGESLLKSIFTIKNYLSKKDGFQSRTLSSPPFTPGVFIARRMFTEEVLKYIEQYDLIEDRSQWLKIFELNEFVKFDYSEIPFVLYRRGDGSVSINKKNPTYLRYKKDQAALTEVQIKKSKSLMYRMFYRYVKLIQAIKSDFLRAMINPAVVTYKLKWLFFKSFYKNK